MSGGAEEVAYAIQFLGTSHQSAGGSVVKGVAVTHPSTLPSAVHVRPGSTRAGIL